MKKFNRKPAIILALLCCLVLCVGCVATGPQTAGQPLEENPQIRAAYKTLSAAASSYDLAMTAIGQLYRDGWIGEEEKAKAIDVGHKFRAAYETACDALTVWAAASEAGAEAKFNTALNEMNGALVRFLDALEPLMERREGK